MEIIASIIIALCYLIRTYICEFFKNKRIEKLNEIDSSKIEAIGNYEKKSSFINRFKKQQ